MKVIEKVLKENDLKDQRIVVLKVTDKGNLENFIKGIISPVIKVKGSIDVGLKMKKNGN